MRVDRHRSRWGRIIAGPLLAGAAAGSWLAVHRRSPIVKAWHPGAGRAGRVGELHARSFGEGPDAVLLLHGLGGSNRYWPASYDTLGRTHRVVAPDLLGFAESLDERRGAFTLEDHVEAIQACVEIAAPGARTLTIIAHSMGSSLALEVALRNPGRTIRVVCSGAPVYAERSGVGEAIAGSNPMARLLLLDTVWAERVCSLNCRHRTAAGVLAALAEPSLPMAITRTTSLHTWPAYRDSLEELVLGYDWVRSTRRLSEAKVPVTFVWGSDDERGDIGYVKTLVSPDSVLEVPSHGHHLPITDSELLLELAVATT